MPELDIAGWEAGPELDAAVAWRVFGTRLTRCDGGFHPGGVSCGQQVIPDPEWSGHRDVLPYSTDSAAAWQVVERMVGNPDYAVTVQVENDIDGGWVATFDGVIDPEWWAEQALPFRQHAREHGMTAAHAICRAALAACQEEA